jgi:hypothetical protein
MNVNNHHMIRVRNTNLSYIANKKKKNVQTQRIMAENILELTTAHFTPIPEPRASNCSEI